MASGDTREIFLSGVCLQEQVDRVLEAKSYAKIKKIKPVLKRMADTHIEMLTKRLEGSEKKEGAPLRQEDAPDGHLLEFGVSALSGHAGSTDDEE